MLGYDLKLAVRSLLARPGFSLLVIFILALAIGGNTAIFSLVDGLFLRPLPLPDAKRLVYLDETAPQLKMKLCAIAYPDFYAWQEHSPAFSGMAVWSERSLNLAAAPGRPAERIRGAMVTHRLASVLGIHPVLGRDFLPQEDRPGGERVALVGYRLWQSRFAADPALVGSHLRLDGQLIRVIGILPAQAVLPDNVDLWLPLQEDAATSDGWYLRGVGRLKDGVSIGQARANLLRIHKSQIPIRKDNAMTAPVVMGLRERYLGDYVRVAGLLLAAVGVVLIIACANVAGLLLASGAARSNELAVRSALGASPRQMLAPLLAETAVLASAGGVAGMLAGAALLRGLLALLPANLPGWVSFSLDWRVLLFTAGISAASALFFGVLPSFLSVPVDVLESLQGVAGRASASRSRHRLLNGFMVAEIAVALVLLIAAGLLLRSFSALMNTSPGFRAQNMLTFRVSLPKAAYPAPAPRAEFFNQTRERLQALPGVDGASAVSSAPLGNTNNGFFEAEGAGNSQDRGPAVQQRITLPGYFDTMGIALVRGRLFAPADFAANAPAAVILDQTFARAFFGASDPVGRRVRGQWPGSPWLIVAGVVRDVKQDGLEAEARPGVYLPYTSAQAVDALTFVVHGTGRPGAIARAARQIVQSQDASVPVFDIRTIPERLGETLALRRSYSLVFAGFALVALLQSIAGVYGIVSYSVRQRVQEIGIRMALGADARRILSEVLERGAVLIAAGIALGLAGTFAASRLLARFVFGLSARDPATFVLVSLTLAAVALLANLIPALRASRVEPVRVLGR